MVNHGSVLEQLYTDKCDIMEATNTMDATTKRKTLTWATVHQGVACRMSYYNSPEVTDGNIAVLKQAIKLFLPLNVTVKEGSRIDVTRDGTAISYVASGEPKRYDITQHQEIELSLKDGEA